MNYASWLDKKYEVNGKKLSHFQVTQLVMNGAMSVETANGLMRATKKINMEDKIAAETDSRKKRIMQQMYDEGIYNTDIF